MKLIPVNGHVVISRCKDPRQQGAIVMEGNSMVFGVVEAVADGVNMIEVDDIAYYPPGPFIKPIITDNNQGKMLLHHSMIIAVVRDVKAEPLDTIVNPPVPEILVAGRISLPPDTRPSY